MGINKRIVDFFIRYIVLVLVAFPNLVVFYFIFTPLTIYPVYFLLNLFFDASLKGTLIFLNGRSLINIIEACVIGSAYYLLLILNLSTPSIKLKKRISVLAFSFGMLLIINIFRIFFLSILFAINSSYFSFLHKAFWYVGSIVIVIAIWFASVETFKIKEVPIFSDFKYLLKNIKK